jgi:hypothetical protein
MKSYAVVAVLFSCVPLGACGGGGGSSQPATPPPLVQPPPPVAINSGGFWSGEIFIESASVTEECAALLTEDGQFRFLCVFTDLQFAGMASLDVNAMTGTGMAFSSLGFLDGSFATDLTLQATLIKETSLVGTWSTAAGDSGTFNMVYDVDVGYERASSLALLEGVWQSTDEFDNPDATFTIDNLGSFTAQNTNSCTSSGMFLILDDRYNLYQVSSTITGCAIAGDYAGLALLGDGIGINDVMLISISNDQRALLVLLEKMP